MTECIYVDYAHKTKKMQVNTYKNGVENFAQDYKIDSCNTFNIAVGVVDKLSSGDTKIYMTANTADALKSQAIHMWVSGCRSTEDNDDTSSNDYIVSSIGDPHCNPTVLGTVDDYMAGNVELVGNSNIEL